MKRVDYLKRRILHNEEECPVELTDVVIYRTINALGQISHIHAPVMAWAVNWTLFDGIIDLTMGRVYDYVVLDRSRMIYKNKPIRFDAAGMMVL